MTKQGRILQDPRSGHGLLVVDGQHYPFTLHDNWRSTQSPAPGMDVDVFFHPQYGLISVQPSRSVALSPAYPPAPAPLAPPPAPGFHAAPGFHPAPAIQPAPVLQAAPGFHTGFVATPATPTSPFTRILDQLKSPQELPNLIAFAVLLVGWFFLPSLRIGFAGFGIDRTFAQLLGNLDNLQALASMNSAAAGFTGSLLTLLGIVALAGPFVHLFVRQRVARLAGCLPLAMLLLIGLYVVNEVHSAAQATSGLLGGALASSMEQSAMGMLHLQLGAYVALAAAGYLAFLAVQKFLAPAQA